MIDLRNSNLVFRYESRMMSVAVLGILFCILATGCVSGLWQPVKPWYRDAPANTLYQTNESYDAIGTDIVDPSDSASQTSSSPHQSNRGPSGSNPNAQQDISSGFDPDGFAVNVNDPTDVTNQKPQQKSTSAPFAVVRPESGSFPPRYDVGNPALKNVDSPPDSATYSNGIANGSGNR